MENYLTEDIYKYENMTLKELQSYNNKELIIKYESILKDILENDKSRFIAKKVLEENKGASLIEIYQKLEEKEQEYESYILFPNSKIILYPSIKEVKSKSFITCDFSGALIYPGSYYLNYRPLLINLDATEKYVLKRTIKVETSYYEELPRNIAELEELWLNMTNETDNNNGIDYSHLNQVNGGSFCFQKLKQR